MPVKRMFTITLCTSFPVTSATHKVTTIIKSLRSKIPYHLKFSKLVSKKTFDSYSVFRIRFCSKKRIFMHYKTQIPTNRIGKFANNNAIFTNFNQILSAFFCHKHVAIFSNLLYFNLAQIRIIYFYRQWGLKLLA